MSDRDPELLSFVLYLSKDKEEKREEKRVKKEKGWMFAGLDCLGVTWVHVHLLGAGAWGPP